MWSLKGFPLTKCLAFASGCKERFSEAKNTDERIERRQRIVQTAKAIILICYCLALNIFLGYIKHYGLNSFSHGLLVISLLSLIYILHLLLSEKVDVDSGKMRTVRAFFYTIAILYMLIMFMCFASFLVLTEKDKNCVDI